MVYLLHDFDLSLHTFPPIGLQKFKLLVYLDSNLLVKKLVKTNSNNSVRPLADSLTYNVVVDVLNSAAVGGELVLTPEIYSRVIIFVFILFHVICEVSVILRLGVGRSGFIRCNGKVTTYLPSALPRLEGSLFVLSKLSHGVSHIGIGFILVDVEGALAWRSLFKL